MEKSDKEYRESKHQSSLFHKIFLVSLCVVVVVQFVVMSKSFATVNNRLNNLEDESPLKSKSLEHDYGPGRTKRHADESDIKKALTKLKRLEKRYKDLANIYSKQYT